MKVLSCFSGIGAFEKALQRQNIKYELVNYCEIDKYASKAYSLIHNISEELNLGDIKKVNEKELKDFDLIVGGSPCQDFSISGKQEGAKWTCEECKHEYNPLEAHYTTRNKCPKCNSINIEKTRSSLLVEWLRILREKMPKYGIYENVKNIVGKKFKQTFDLFEKELQDYGYNTYWKVLNAKYYGIPQSRERVYLIIIRKDIDDNKFEFPIGFDNGIRLKDLSEDDVDEKYYIPQEKTDKLIEKLKDKKDTCAGTYNQKDGFKEKDIGCTLDASYYKGLGCNQNRNAVLKVGNINPSENGMNGCVYSDEGIAPTITTNKGEGNKILQVGLLDIKGNEQVRRVDSSDGISPTLNSMQGGNRQPKILEENELIFLGGIDTTEKWIDNDKELSRNYKEGYRVYDSEGIACCQKTNGGGLGSNTGLYCVAMTGRYNDDGKIEQQLEIRYDKFTNAITTVQKDSIILESVNYRIRKLTPLECIRLMGFDDEDYYILKENKISNYQIYKMAGNSIVVNVLEEIFKKLLK